MKVGRDFIQMLLFGAEWMVRIKSDAVGTNANRADYPKLLAKYIRIVEASLENEHRPKPKPTGVLNPDLSGSK